MLLEVLYHLSVPLPSMARGNRGYPSTILLLSLFASFPSPYRFHEMESKIEL